MKEKDIKELRAISSPLMYEREVLIKPTKRFINLLLTAFDEIENNAKSNKESEDKTMLHNVTITKTEEKVLEEYWCVRGIKENIVTNAKSVIGEMKCTKEPTLNEIAVFLENSGAGFVSVEHNYRFEPDLPFC